MASVIKVGTQRRAQVRRKGFPTETRTFPTKGLATAWAATTESNMLAMKHQDMRIISKMTLTDLIDRHTEEIGAVKPFGKNKRTVLVALKVQLGDIVLPALTVERLTKFIQDRRKAFPIPTRKSGKHIIADVRDVGKYLDDCRTQH